MSAKLSPTEVAELERLMTAMADGDISATVRLSELFGSRIASVVRRHLRDLHRRDLAESSADVASLTGDAVLVIFDKAGGWSPEGGALPWVWAERAIRAAVVAAVGHPTVELDPSRHDQPASATPDSRDLADCYMALVRRDRRVRLLDTAIRAVGSERDQEVFRHYRMQQALGDPSPAQTVATEFGISPANARQIVHRHRLRLHRLAVTTPEFGPILDSGWVAA